MPPFFFVNTDYFFCFYWNLISVVFLESEVMEKITDLSPSEKALIECILKENQYSQRLACMFPKNQSAILFFLSRHSNFKLRPKTQNEFMNEANTSCSLWDDFVEQTGTTLYRWPPNT